MESRAALGVFRVDINMRAKELLHREEIAPSGGFRECGRFSRQSFAASAHWTCVAVIFEEHAPMKLSPSACFIAARCASRSIRCGGGIGSGGETSPGSGLGIAGGWNGDA